MLLLFGGSESSGGGGGGDGTPIGLLLALTVSSAVTPPAVGGFKRGGSGRLHPGGRRFKDDTTGRVAEWWDRYDALVKRTQRLKEEQRTAAQLSTEAVSRTIEAIEETGASEAVQRQFEAMIAAVDRAIKAKTAAKVMAAAKQAEEEAIRILAAIEDENAAILLLLA